ncbi:hypothetical protein VaNZ11_000412 [Volvox africanus]|uniref:J domain-containing protein n=1 Tax=Volvox africanus TaxID=51714 RepID=A0ABQ5RMX7_9CHLO|nr:hypothetical protein VaNZ11_000412 [Volvox africanus]
MSQEISNIRSTVSFRAQARCALPCMTCSASGHARQRAVHIQRLQHACCRVAMPLGRVKQFQVFAFRDASGRQAGKALPPARSMSVSEHVSIAVDYYRLLQVPRVSRPDAIRKSYKNFVKQPPATAYSADTLFARAVLLKAAAESLIDPDLRRSYDAKLAAGHSALRVSQQDLPGALVVLQEIGEFQLVLDHGRRWLELNGSQPDAGDVAAAVALAYCDRAGERLATPSNKDAVLPACDDLDAALVQLRRYGMARQLQTQIVGALRDLAPEYACELVALPLGPDTAARRAKGVALMRGVLRSAAMAVAGDLSGTTEGPGAALISADSDPQSVVSQARRMLQRGRDVLTCDEQVALLPDALRGSGVTAHPDVLYDGALAYIVDGYRNGWPQSVHQADLLLQRLEEHVRRQAAAQLQNQDPVPPPGDTVGATQPAQLKGAAAAEAMPEHDEAFSEGVAAGGAEGTHGGTVALERAVCAILLGDYAAAVALLGLADGAVKGTDAEMVPMATAEMQLRNFVMEHAPSGTNDMRPGLRALATKWLAGVALHSFRDTVGQTAMPLETYWFANPRVAIYLQVWSTFRANEKMLAATHFLCNLLPDMVRVFSGVGTKIVAAMALAALRVQRILAVILGLAAAAVAPKPRRNTARIPVNRCSGPQGVTGKDVASTAQRGPATTVSIDEAATGTVETSAAGPNRLSPAPTLSPFGHPYGKTLQSVANETSRTPLGPIGDVAAKRAAPTQGATAPGPFSTAAASAAVTMATVADSSSNLDLRRRFAASAAVDAAVSMPGFRGSHDPHGVGHDDHDGEVALPDDDLDLDLDDPSSTRRRGMTEQELRAHLAGLELAMWDSELPSRGASPQRITFLAVCAVATLAALFFFVIRWSGGGVSPMVCRTDSVASAVASITVSTFVPPK